MIAEKLVLFECSIFLYIFVLILQIFLFIIPSFSMVSHHYSLFCWLKANMISRIWVYDHFIGS